MINLDLLKIGNGVKLKFTINWKQITFFDITVHRAFPCIFKSSKTW